MSCHIINIAIIIFKVSYNFEYFFIVNKVYSQAALIYLYATVERNIFHNIKQIWSYINEKIDKIISYKFEIIFYANLSFDFFSMFL